MDEEAKEVEVLRVLVSKDPIHSSLASPACAKQMDKQYVTQSGLKVSRYIPNERRACTHKKCGAYVDKVFEFWVDVARAHWTGKEHVPNREQGGQRKSLCQ